MPARVSSIRGSYEAHAGTRALIAAPLLLAFAGWDEFRWAFLLQYALWTVGAVQVVRYRTATRRQLARGVGRDLVAATAS